jgi:ABC-type phosphate/phosphonate transport system substrate-binding protein
MLIATSVILWAFASGVPAVQGAERGGATLKLGIVPFYTPEKIWQLYRPFVDYLTANSGSAWELRLVKDHEELVAGLCDGSIDVAMPGPIPYGKMLNRCAPRPLLLTLGGDGRPFYQSVIVTATPGIRALADLRGKKFALYEGSTAAHYLPLKMLAAAGLGLKDVQPVYVRSQDQLVAAVMGGEAVAGGIKSALYERLKSPALLVVQRSEDLPNFVFCASPLLRPEQADGFVSALTRLRPREDPAHRDLVKGWDVEVQNGFVKPSASFDADVRALFHGVMPFVK